MAKDEKMDIVLRNMKTDPPIIKVMSYRKELLQRLFDKLGKTMETSSKSKMKTVRIASTNISAHDFEMRKRQCITFDKLGGS